MYYVFVCFTVAASENEVLLPHAFERLWGALASQGEFLTHIVEAVPQGRVVRHLNDRGFQVQKEHVTIGGSVRRGDGGLVPTTLRHKNCC